MRKQGRAGHERKKESEMPRREGKERRKIQGESCRQKRKTRTGRQKSRKKGGKKKKESHRYKICGTLILSVNKMRRRDRDGQIFQTERAWN